MQPGGATPNSRQWRRRLSFCPASIPSSPMSICTFTTAVIVFATSLSLSLFAPSSSSPSLSLQPHVKIRGGDLEWPSVRPSVRPSVQAISEAASNYGSAFERACARREQRNNRVKDRIYNLAIDDSSKGKERKGGEAIKVHWKCVTERAISLGRLARSVSLSRGNDFGSAASASVSATSQVLIARLLDVFFVIYRPSPVVLIGGSVFYLTSCNPLQCII